MQPGTAVTARWVTARMSNCDPARVRVRALSTVCHHRASCCNYRLPQHTVVPV